MTNVTLTTEEWGIAKAGTTQNILNLAPGIIAATIAPIDTAIAADPGKPSYTIDVDVGTMRACLLFSWIRGAKGVSSKID